MGLALEVAPLEAAKVGLAGAGARGLEQLERAGRIVRIPGDLRQVEPGSIQRALERILGGREGPVRGLGRGSGAACLDRLGVGAQRLVPARATPPDRPEPAALSGSSGRAAPTHCRTTDRPSRRATAVPPRTAAPRSPGSAGPTAPAARRSSRAAPGSARRPRTAGGRPPDPRLTRTGATARARSLSGRSSPSRGVPRD